jgi:dTDP-4-dehydrorhamnose reductase
MSDLVILGAHGQVGRALVAEARQRSVSNRAFGHAECDISDRSAVDQAIKAARFVLNCAAYTAVDRAETEVEAANRVNRIGAGNVADACAQAAIPLFHLSTDYVFDGHDPRPAREDDEPRPLSVYGQSKLGGELAIRERLKSHIILRTSWIFSAHGQNFVKTILRLASARPELRVVADQIGGPTAADDIATAILDIIAAIYGAPDFDQWGTYHFSGVPAVSWFEFAKAIVADRNAVVLPIATKDYSLPARRPLNSVLDCSRVHRFFGIAQPDWRVALRNVLNELAVKSR